MPLKTMGKVGAGLSVATLLSASFIFSIVDSKYVTWMAMTERDRWYTSQMVMRYEDNIAEVDEEIETIDIRGTSMTPHERARLYRYVKLKEKYLRRIDRLERSTSFSGRPPKEIL